MGRCQSNKINANISPKEVETKLVKRGAAGWGLKRLGITFKANYHASDEQLGPFHISTLDSKSVSQSYQFTFQYGVKESSFQSFTNSKDGFCLQLSVHLYFTSKCTNNHGSFVMPTLYKCSLVPYEKHKMSQVQLEPFF